MDEQTAAGQPASVAQMAILCFASDSNSFQGRILLHSSSDQYGLMGKKTKPPSTPYHQCCFEDEPLFFKVTFIDYARSTEHVVKHVMKTNGDNCSLTCEDIEFHTDQLYVGVKAESMIKSYFSDKLLSKECYVCTGKIKIQGDLRKKLFCGQSDEDSDSDF